MASRLRTEENFRVCQGVCGRMTRPSRMPKSQAPDTVTRQAHGKCQSCLRGEGIYIRRGDNPHTDAQTEEMRFESTVQALDNYMKRRRERLDRVSYRVLI